MFEIEVADDVLTAQPGGFSEFPGMFTGWRADVCFLISPLPPGQAREISELGSAAQAAVDRFHFVTGGGIELPGPWAVFDDDVPNGFVGPCRFEDGVIVGAGGQDGTWPPQAATMLRIVLGELHSRKVSARVSCPPSTLDVWALPVWSPVDESSSVRSARTHDDSGKRWYVVRTVRCVTTTGLRYFEDEWLRPDRTWSRDMAEAISFEQTPNGRAVAGDLVVTLREAADPADRRFGEVNGLLTQPEDQARPDLLPPDAIRDHGHVWAAPTSG